MIYACQSQAKNGAWLDIVTTSSKRKALGSFRRVKKSLPDFNLRVVSIEVVVQEKVIAQHENCNNRTPNRKTPAV